MTQIRFQNVTKKSEKGVALISALLLLILMSALAVALMYKVNYEQRLQVTDSGNNVAFYGAEAGMEKMMSDLNALYKLQAAPGCSDVNNLTLTPPPTADVGVAYPQYGITLPDGTTLNNCIVPPSRVQVISQGSNAGLQAQVVPLRMNVASLRPAGESVSLIRQVEVARIPIFQFGIFSDSDLSYFPGPDFDFKGRVHTNGNLFIAAGGGSHIWFHDYMRAAKDVVRDQLANGGDTKTQGRTGLVLIPNTTSGCDTKPTSQITTCLDLAYGEGSSIGGPTATNGGSGTTNSAWPTTSTGPTPANYNSWILSGVKPLKMAFVQGNVDPIEIIRKPKDGEDIKSTLYESRLYSEAQIRVLLTDDPAELPGGAGDPQNIRLANYANPGGPDYSNGVTVGGVGATYFAEGTTATFAGGVPAGTNIQDTNWVSPPVPFSNKNTLVRPGADTNAPIIGGGPQWNLLDGYLRVEYLDKDTLGYVPVTKEWLELGFARGFTPPNRAVPNSVNRNAILILQELADRNADGVANAGAPSGSTASTRGPSACSLTNPYTWSAPTSCSCTSSGTGCTSPAKKWSCSCSTPYSATPPELAVDTLTNSTITGAATRNNWYPINMYDTREGEFRDNNSGLCKVNGVLNLVEIDVYNLSEWLKGVIGASGAKVEYKSQNGYILYFSDRRGMEPNKFLTPIAKNGEYGFEDVLNASSATGDPDGVLDRGEDVNQNKNINPAPDVWGVDNLGLGFGLGANAGKTTTPATPVACATGAGAARTNWVSGARHGVRLVHGSQGALPTRPDNGLGGFTLASENPAYVLGNYNAVDGTCSGTSCFGDPHASSAVIADTVTLLSNNWSDLTMFKNPTKPGSRPASDTWYRVAIATGKNVNFPVAPYAGFANVANDFGTDGGVHNFLRYLESWGGQNIYYKGSMASMYYSMYATGVFKCCTTVYSPPSRNYAFDLDFNDLSKMPPGTPTVTDVVNLGFQQVF